MERNSEIDWALCKELPATEFQVWERQKKRPQKKRHTHTHPLPKSWWPKHSTHSSGHNQSNLLRRRHLYPQKESHNPTKKTSTKSTPEAFFTPQNHTTPKLKQQHNCFPTHKTQNPKLKQQHICLTTHKKKNPKTPTTTTTKLPLYPQNKEPQNSTTTQLMREALRSGRQKSIKPVPPMTKADMGDDPSSVVMWVCLHQDLSLQIWLLLLSATIQITQQSRKKIRRNPRMETEEEMCLNISPSSSLFSFPSTTTLLLLLGFSFGISQWVF